MRLTDQMFKDYKNQHQQPVAQANLSGK